MLNSEVLNSLLERGRALQEEISAFIIRKEYNTLPSLPLAKRIDDLIGKIKSELPEPSSNEDDNLKSLISNLGRIAQNFESIKKFMLKHPTIPSTQTFFKLNKFQLELQKLIGNLNQLENSLQPRISYGPAI